MGNKLLIDSADLEAAAYAVLHGSRTERVNWLNICRVLNGEAAVANTGAVGVSTKAARAAAFTNITNAVSGKAA